MSSNTAESGTTAAVLEDIEQKCRELATTSPENTQKIAADLLGMGKAYYHDACMRAQQASEWRWALQSLESCFCSALPRSLWQGRLTARHTQPLVEASW